MNLNQKDYVEEIVKAVPIPVNAIGGLNKNNIDILENTGIAGVCVVSAIMKADNPQKAAEEIKEKFAAIK